MLPLLAPHPRHSSWHEELECEVETYENREVHEWVSEVQLTQGCETDRVEDGRHDKDWGFVHLAQSRSSHRNTGCQVQGQARHKKHPAQTGEH